MKKEERRERRKGGRWEEGWIAGSIFQLESQLPPFPSSLQHSEG